MFYFTEHTDLSFPCTKLMAKMYKARDACWERSGKSIFDMSLTFSCLMEYSIMINTVKYGWSILNL